MKKIFVLLVLVGMLSSCGSSPYVGNWESVGTDGKVDRQLMINDDGTVVSKWKEGDQTLVREGTWKEEDGSIILNGSNASAKGQLQQDKLIFDAQKKVRHHFTRQQMRHSH